MRPYSAGWSLAFRSWWAQWRSSGGGLSRADPEWFRAYKLAFRAGWRAAMMYREGKKT
jgi:hypothetical protein